MQFALDNLSRGTLYVLSKAVSGLPQTPTERGDSELTDPDPHLLKSAAAYLREIARRPDAGRRHRKQPKIDALREYKEEILEAHQSGLSVHRIAQIFRERGVDISVPHLVRTIRRFIDEEGRSGGKTSGGQHGPMTDSPEAANLKTPVTYQVAEQSSSGVQEEEFAKQLRIARYLAAASPPARVLEPGPEARVPKRVRSVTKAKRRTKTEAPRKKAGEAELAKERRRAGRAVRQKAPASGSQRSEKGRGSPGR